jgi:protein O-GlcNAc transferase
MTQATQVNDSGAAVAYARGYALLQSGDFANALGAFDEAAALVPSRASVQQGRASALLMLQRFDAAVDAYRAALRAEPRSPQVQTALGFLYIQLRQYGSAVEAFTGVLAYEPKNTDALRGRAQCLFVLGRIEEAVSSYDALLAVDPDMDYMMGERFHAQLHCCDWRDYEPRRRLIAERVRSGARADVPGCFMCHSDSPGDQRLCAQTFARDVCSIEPLARRPAPRPFTGKIRVAYLSADFFSHATSYLAAGLFERHDRSRFETYAFSFGLNDGSPMRKRLEGAFDEFVDVSGCSDEQIAAQVVARHIDIAVDVKGHTLGARPRIFALRPAPVQVSFLAYPGTMGTDFIDYIVADDHVIPDASRPHYSEQVISLPGSYQINDADRPPAPRPTRRAAGLPEEAFVFCCFNSTYKVTPVVFDTWMRIVGSTPGSVLWLLESSAPAVRNLRSETAARGIDPQRLIFAPRVAPEQHWARNALADLSLDTLPCNAHTTASDSLWAGVPIITVAGATFTSRVATSLLHAVGLACLSVASLEDYERLAVRLANSPEELRDLKSTLSAARKSSSLFDPALYAARLEAAYVEIWARSQRQENPSPVRIGASGVVVPDAQRHR